MKTKEELNALKEEVETLNKKLRELNGKELEQVVGGICKSGLDVYVSEDCTICEMTKRTGHSKYNSLDKSKPQSCGNCMYFANGLCLYFRLE